MSGRLTPRVTGMTAAARATMADALAHLTTDGVLIRAGDPHMVTVTAARDTRTDARLLAVGTPYRAGRVVGGFRGHWSGGPRHDTAARSVAATAYGMRAELVGRWDAEDGGTLSLYALTERGAR